MAAFRRIAVDEHCLDDGGHILYENTRCFETLSGRIEKHGRCSEMPYGRSSAPARRRVALFGCASSSSVRLDVTVGRVETVFICVEKEAVSVEHRQDDQKRLQAARPPRQAAYPRSSALAGKGRLHEEKRGLFRGKRRLHFHGVRPSSRGGTVSVRDARALGDHGSRLEGSGRPLAITCTPNRRAGRLFFVAGHFPLAAFR